MKRLILATITLVFFYASGFSQSTFNGQLIYSIAVKGENAEQMAAFMPTSYEYFVSGSNLMFRMNGGMTAMMMGDIIVHGETGEAYMVKHSEKTAYKMPADDEAEAEVSSPPVIKKLAEKETILGYSCQKYEVVTMDAETGENTTQFMWVTDQLTFEKPSSGKSTNTGNVFVEGINGMPLKIESNVMGFTMIMTATTLEKKTISKSEFVIPADYEIKAFDPSMFGGGGR